MITCVLSQLGSRQHSLVAPDSVSVLNELMRTVNHYRRELYSVCSHITYPLGQSSLYPYVPFMLMSYFLGTQTFSPRGVPYVRTTLFGLAGLISTALVEFMEGSSSK